MTPPIMVMRTAAKIPIVVSTLPGCASVGVGVNAAVGEAVGVRLSVAASVTVIV